MSLTPFGLCHKRFEGPFVVTHYNTKNIILAFKIHNSPDPFCPQGEKGDIGPPGSPGPLFFIPPNTTTVYPGLPGPPGPTGETGLPGPEVKGHKGSRVRNIKRSPPSFKLETFSLSAAVMLKWFEKN